MATQVDHNYDPNQWVCSVCTLFNHTDTQLCMVCGAQRGQDNINQEIALAQQSVLSSLHSQKQLAPQPLYQPQQPQNLNGNISQKAQNEKIEAMQQEEVEYEEVYEEIEIEVEEEFVAEEWTYDRVTYLLDTSTNYLYSPSTLEFIGKKTGEFSIDFNAKER